MRIIGKLFIWGAVLFLAGAVIVVATARPVDAPIVEERANSAPNLMIHVTAERVNVYNRAWDGVGQVGGILGPLLPAIAIESPPDLVPCIVEEQRTRCFANKRGGGIVSYCHDSFSCRWAVKQDRRGSFALVVFDLDEIGGRSVSDLVDSILLNPGSNSRIVERRARQLIERIAPTRIQLPKPLGSFTWRPGEAQRRQRVMSQATISYCSLGCELDQSTITLN